MVSVAPAARVTPLTVIVWPETETVPVELVVYPWSVLVVDGADQFAGTATSTAPFLSPPVAAVYVSVSVFPVVPANTEVGEIVSVPDPSALLLTARVGEAPIAVRLPPLVDFSRVVHVPVPDWPAAGASALS